MLRGHPAYSVVKFFFWRVNYTSNEPDYQTCVQSTAVPFIMLADQRSKARLAACVMSQIRLFKIEFGTKQYHNFGQAHGYGIALFRFRTRKPGRQRGEILLLVK